MAISLRDRQRVADLVKSEFRAKYEDATREPSDLEIQTARQNLEKTLRIAKTIADLEAAENKVEDLRKKLAATVRAAKPETMVMEERTSRRWGNCECTADYREMLADIASHVAKISVRNGGNRFTIAKDERRLLAKIEVAETTQDLSVIMKSAGLV